MPLHPTTVLQHSLLIQHLNLPTQQASELGRDDSLLLSTSAFRRYSALRRRAPGLGTLGIVTKRFSLADARGGEVVLPIDGLDCALETTEEAFGSNESALEVQGV